MGARLGVVLGALLWVFAAGVFYTPLSITTESGSKIGCGSAASPDTNPSIVDSCGPLPAQRRMQAIWILAGGIVVAIGGIAAFGLVDRRGPGFDSAD